MESVRVQLQLFARRFGLLNATCCEDCCGEQVSLVQSHILFEIRRRGNPSMQQVAEELGVDVTTFSRQVKSLEAKGLVVRRVSPDDRRVMLLGLTGEGTRVLTQIDEYMAAKLELIFSAMTTFEKEIVVSSLALLNRAVSAVSQGDSIAVKKIACCNQ